MENRNKNNSQFSTFNSQLNKDYQSRRPRILFLADRNILADQAFNSFSAFPDDAMVRIKPKEIKKKGKVPTNGSVFFTIFQTFMTNSMDNEKLTMENEENNSQFSTFNFQFFPKDFFDFIIILCNIS